jgi:hypothetical protein
MAGPYSQAHLDHAARQMGFHDYATYSAYQQKQTARRLDNGIQGTGAPTGQPAPQNWLQHLLSSIPGTPAYLFGYVNDQMGKALGNGQ